MYCKSVPCVLFKVCSIYCTICALCIIQCVICEFYIKIKRKKKDLKLTFDLCDLI